MSEGILHFFGSNRIKPSDWPENLAHYNTLPNQKQPQNQGISRRLFPALFAGCVHLPCFDWFNLLGRSEESSFFSFRLYMNMPFLFSESLERLHKKSEKTSSLPPQNNTALGLVRLDPSNERSLVSEAPPGSITFALLVDVENVQEAVKSPLISAFSDVVHHYKRLVSFNF